jgi:HEAT repeat protein
LILVILTIVFGSLVVLELAALVARRAWLDWKLGPRQRLVHDAFEQLADALVFGTAIEAPAGRIRRRAFRLAALELFSPLSGESCARLARLVEDAGVVDDTVRALRRSPRAFARRRAADGLGELRSRRLAPALEAGLGDRDPIVRVACARSLLRIPELGRLDRILGVLDRDGLADPIETEWAFIALAEAAPDALVRLQDTANSARIRWYAALVLARAKREEALPTLREALATDNSLIVSHAVHGIAAVGGAKAGKVLVGVAADEARDAAVRELAGRELARLRTLGGTA